MNDNHRRGDHPHEPHRQGEGAAVVAIDVFNVTQWRIRLILAESRAAQMNNNYRRLDRPYELHQLDDDGAVVTVEVPGITSWRIALALAQEAANRQECTVRLVMVPKVCIAANRQWDEADVRLIDEFRPRR